MDSNRPDSAPATLGDVRHLRRNTRGAILTAGLAMLCFVGGVVIAVSSINHERSKRLQTVSQVIDLFCNTDNGQDQLLATLVSSSIHGSGDGFGAGLDPSTLSPFTVRVLDSIQEVTERTQGQGVPPEFRRVLKELRDLLPCETLVRNYLNGESVAQLLSAVELPASSDPVEQTGEAVRNGVRSH